MINTLPLNTNKNITLTITPADLKFQGEKLSYRTILGAFLSDTAPHPILLDITSGYSSIRSYSHTLIRLDEHQDTYLPVTIDYSERLGDLVPQDTRLILDPRTIPAENITVDWGDFADPNNPSWRLTVTIPLPTFEKAQ